MYVCYSQCVHIGTQTHTHTSCIVSHVTIQFITLSFLNLILVVQKLLPSGMWCHVVWKRYHCFQANCSVHIWDRFVPWWRQQGPHKQCCQNQTTCSHNNQKLKSHVGIESGPPWVPVLGSALHVHRLRKQTGYLYRATAELAKCYGPVVGLRIGKDRQVVLCGYEAIRDMLSRDEFDGRPQGIFYETRTWGKRRGEWQVNTTYDCLKRSVVASGAHPLCTQFCLSDKTVDSSTTT